MLSVPLASCWPGTMLVALLWKATYLPSALTLSAKLSPFGVTEGPPFAREIGTTVLGNWRNSNCSTAGRKYLGRNPMPCCKGLFVRRYFAARLRSPWKTIWHLLISKKQNLWRSLHGKSAGISQLIVQQQNGGCASSNTRSGSLECEHKQGSDGRLGGHHP